MNVFLPVYVLLWRLKYLFCENIASHISHLNAFLSVYSVLCWFKYLLCEICLFGYVDFNIFWCDQNSSSHTSHLKWFSSVCILLCRFKNPFCENVASHWSHLISFPRVCIIWLHNQCTSFTVDLEFFGLLTNSIHYHMNNLSVAKSFWDTVYSGNLSCFLFQASYHNYM